MASTTIRRLPARRKKARCPICRRPEAARFAPFCSRRCADTDLANWLGGGYRIPGTEPAAAAPDEDDDDG